MLEICLLCEIHVKLMQLNLIPVSLCNWLGLRPIQTNIKHKILIWRISGLGVIWLVREELVVVFCPLADVGLDGWEGVNLVNQLVQVRVLRLDEVNSPHTDTGLHDANEPEINPCELEEEIIFLLQYFAQFVRGN